MSMDPQWIASSLAGAVLWAMLGQQARLILLRQEQVRRFERLERRR